MLVTDTLWAPRGCVIAGAVDDDTAPYDAALTVPMSRRDNRVGALLLSRLISPHVDAALTDAARADATARIAVLHGLITPAQARALAAELRFDGTTLTFKSAAGERAWRDVASQVERRVFASPAYCARAAVCTEAPAEELAWCDRQQWRLSDEPRYGARPVLTRPHAWPLPRRDAPTQWLYIDDDPAVTPAVTPCRGDLMYACAKALLLVLLLVLVLALALPSLAQGAPGRAEPRGQPRDQFRVRPLRQ